jgi:DNA mismatch repair protein MSH3
VADDDFRDDAISMDDSISSGVPEDIEEGTIATVLQSVLSPLTPFRSDIPRKSSNAKRKKLSVQEQDDDNEPAPARHATSSSRVQTASDIAARLQAIEPDAERHRLFSNKITGSGRALRGDTGEPDDDDDEPDDDDADGGDAIEVEEEPKSKSKGPPKPGAKVKYTPLEQQYLEVKAKYPDTILFVEAGYRFRFFGKDAEVASKVLGIMASWSHNFLTSSIPTQRLHVHARRIVQAGYKVGVVSQTETAALKKVGSNKSGPFARALTGLYTKGTMVGGDIDPLLVGDVNLGNYLLALVEEVSQTDASKVRISIAAVKTSTGEIVWDTFEDSFLRNELETRLRHLRPIEIIHPSNLSEPSKKLVRIFQVESQADAATAPGRTPNSASEGTSPSSKLDGIRIEEISPTRFDDEKALQTVESLLQNSATASAKFMHAFPRLLLKCIGGLVGYLKDFGLANLFCLECNYIHFSETSRMRLDGKTLDNLELIRNQTNGSHKGSLLWILDRTRSVFGKRLLAGWLQHPLTDSQYEFYLFEAPCCP